MTRLVLVVAAFYVVAFPAVGVRADEQEGHQFFEQDVLPILKANCFKCHGGEAKIRGGLRLTSREALLQGGDTGPAVELDDGAESLLLSAINYEDYEMPPDGKLPPEQIEILTRWVTSGLPYPEGLVKTADTGEEKHSPQVTPENMKFWSFRPVERPDEPEVGNQAWARNPIDAFVLAKLEAAGLAPNPPAKPQELVRRIYYDLIGLPPTPKQVEDFLRDCGVDPQATDAGPSAVRVPRSAIENLVDRLLASPHYGEKWGRHWLDLVRYAESNSYERDDAKPEVWRYRDYVIRSFNEDKPYDRFILEQLAGDELAEVTPDSIIATGYYRLGRWDDEPVSATQAWYDDMDDVLATTSQVYLGLTMNCARCHDHKLDPIPQEDYYRFLSFFSNVTRYGGPRRGRDVKRWSLRPLDTPDLKKRHEERIAAHARQLKEIETRIGAIEQEAMKFLSPPEKEDFQYESNRPDVLRKHVPEGISRQRLDRYVQLRQRREALLLNPPGSLGQALCVKENGSKPRPMHLLVRGNPKVQGKPVAPGFPRILGFDDPEIPDAPPGANSTGRRRVLAEWIASGENPLTARVLVNRLWQYHFGRGIVRSPSDFGFQGRPPTHPDLLNWLAADFLAEGWRIKRMHKLIMLSATYQQSSRARDDALARDPENDLFWRFDMRRLTAEEVRDSILAVNGTLNPDMGGPSIFPIIPQAVLAGQSRPGNGWGKSQPQERNRRSIYIHLKRSLLVPILENHDMADVDSSCPVRFVTTVPSQALGLLNSEFLNEEAAKFAAYVQEKSGDDPQQQVALALARVTQREPREKEIDRGVALIDDLRNDHHMNDETALKYFCLMALNLNEFVYLD